MEELKDDYRDGESFVQYAVDTLLLPIRIATSPVLLRTYLRGILLFVTSAVLLAFAAIAYTSFYYAYIPVRGITAPIYLQFDHGSAAKHTILQSHDVATRNWPYGIANIPGLVSRQKYDVVVEMTVPRSRRNLNAGNWMVGLEMRGPSIFAAGVKGMLGWDEEWNVDDHGQGGPLGAAAQKTHAEGQADTPVVIARSRRPAILTYRSYIIEHVHRLLRLPLYLFGWHTESERIEITMMESIEFDKGTRNVPTSVRIELRSGYPLEIYTVSIRFSARLQGLRWLMYRYRISSAIIGTMVFWTVEMLVLIFTWGVFTLVFNTSPTSTPIQNPPIKIKIKQENNSNPKTPLPSTPHTFPSLPSHLPLHYPSPLLKSEPNSPSLYDIPTAEPEEAEADDEDDDFVLEEPLSGGQDKEASFMDSGIGTGVESGVEREGERERGLRRRRER